jgi:fructose-1,6-bisphosphatase/sedoheptulose 1,7-bisphosphatase-like protein
MDSLQMDGTIVIGEGERDEADALSGKGTSDARPSEFSSGDIAVDPLEGTNLWRRAQRIRLPCCGERARRITPAPICTWKNCDEPSCKGAVDLDAPVADNLKAIAKRLTRCGRLGGDCAGPGRATRID